MINVWLEQFITIHRNGEDWKREKKVKGFGYATFDKTIRRPVGNVRWAF